MYDNPMQGMITWFGISLWNTSCQDTDVNTRTYRKTIRPFVDGPNVNQIKANIPRQGATGNIDLDRMKDS